MYILKFILLTALVAVALCAVLTLDLCYIIPGHVLGPVDVFRFMFGGCIAVGAFFGSVALVIELRDQYL